MKGPISRLAALLAVTAGLAACVPTFNAGCVTDPATGQVRCHGDYIPPPIAPASTPDDR